jgi:hypothetical protein
MFFDQKRNAYIDSDTGEVVLQEGGDVEMPQITNAAAPSKSNTTSLFSPTIARPSGASSGNSYTPISKTQKNTIAPSPEGNEEILGLEQEYYNLQLSSPEMVDQPVGNNHHSHSVWDDWTLARTLQNLEFEITNEMFEGTTLLLIFSL